VVVLVTTRYSSGIETYIKYRRGIVIRRSRIEEVEVSRTIANCSGVINIIV